MRLTNLIAALAGSLALAGCSSDPSNVPVDDGSLDPPAAGTGIQLQMVSSIAPGFETERCKFFVAPKEGLHVNREQVRYTPGSHHVLLFTTSYSEIPTKTKAGVEVDTSGVVDCPNGAPGDWDVNRVLGGSQSFEGASMLNTLPKGVAVTIEPGTVLLMNVHYLNASSEELETDARINLYSIPKEEVEQEAGLLFYYNPFISVPASGSATARMRCPVEKDISVINVQSHMHRRGVGFVADLTDESGAKLDTIYTSASWEEVPVKQFEPLLKVKAGQALDYRCEYQNTEARDIIQGATTKDEMCMLIGAYYPRDKNLEVCRSQEGMFSATWIGSGSADGIETLSCLSSAADDGSFYSCVVHSCPEISQEITAIARCQMTVGYGQCSSACSGTDADTCRACMEKACGEDIKAMSAATCG